MSVDDMDEFTVQYAYAYGEWQYKEGYEQGKKDAVKHSHWERYDRWCNGYAYMCSLCGKLSSSNKDEHLEYCSHCGARMDGDNSETD